MSKRHDKNEAEELQVETLKQKRLRERDRERHRKLFTFVGIALGLALALVVAGIVYQFLVFPNSQAAKVGDTTITASQFQRRVKFEKNSLQNQLTRYQTLEQQFGGQGYFQNQIDQLSATLANPISIGNQTLDNMVEDVLIAQEAAKRGITVTDEEVDQALREEVANSQGLVTEAQATATAEADANATATAAAFTPTPVPTVDPSAPVTATAEATATLPPPPPAAIITDTTFTQGLSDLEKNLVATSGLSLAEYRAIVRSRLLRDKLSTAIGDEKVTPTEEQVRARHILLSVAPPTPTPTAPVTGTTDITATAPVTAPVTDTEAVTSSVPVSPSAEVTTATAATATAAVTESAPITATALVTEASPVTATNAVTAATVVTQATPVTATAPATATASVTTTAPVTASASVTATAPVTATGDVTATGALTATGELTATAATTATVGSHGPYPDAEALALANELRSRILAGEDFAALAAAYSDDPGSAVQGGDLGWFGKGMMVAPFEEAAFSLPLNQVSEPIKTDFGYHLIEVVEKDANRPKDEQKLTQERAQAFQQWVNEQLGSDTIQRTGDLPSILPPGL